MGTYRLRQDGLAWSELAGETVILDLESSLYFTAKGAVASTLIRELVAGASDDTLVKTVTEDYEVDEAVARRDVEEFLATLQDRGLLEPGDD